MNRPAPELQHIGIQLGLFFLSQKENNFLETAKFLQKLNITDIQLSRDAQTVIIHTSRPGLLIGTKGKNIEGLTKALAKKIHIVESFSWADVITPLDYDAIEDY